MQTLVAGSRHLLPILVLQRNDIQHLHKPHPLFIIFWPCGWHSFVPYMEKRRTTHRLRYLGRFLYIHHGMDILLVLLCFQEYLASFKFHRGVFSRVFLDMSDIVAAHSFTHIRPRTSISPDPLPQSSTLLSFLPTDSALAASPASLLPFSFSPSTNNLTCSGTCSTRLYDPGTGSP